LNKQLHAAKGILCIFPCRTSVQLLKEEASMSCKSDTDKAIAIQQVNHSHV